MAMTVLQVLLCAVFMVSAVMSKPVHLSEGGGSSKSSESNESNESEETATDSEPSQDPLQAAQTETDIPTAAEETDPAATAGTADTAGTAGTADLLPSSDSGASPAPLDSSALPSEDPATFTDAPQSDGPQLVPSEPSQAAQGTDIPPDPAQDTVRDTGASPQPEITATGIFMGIGGTAEPHVITATTAYQGFPQGATPPFPTHNKPTVQPSSTAPSLLVPVSPALTAGPVCFTFQFPESDPPRGDSI